jgi:hypothetical protein
MLFITVLFSYVFIEVSASNIEYHLEEEGAKIWINRDGTIDLQYKIEITCDKGTINYVEIDQPTGDFTLGYASDSTDRDLRVEDASDGSHYKVRVYLAEPLQEGNTISFYVTTNVGHMIWRDDQNPGNVGLQFIPCTWNTIVKSLNIMILLPEGIEKSEVRNSPDWDNVFVDPEENRLTLYWERYNLSPNEEFTVGVSFSEKYVEWYETKKSGFLEGVLPYLIIIPFFVFFFLIVGVIIYSVKKRPYIAPQLQIESLGVRRGLTAVEAGYILDIKPEKIMTMILYSLLKKRIIWVKETEPSIKLEVIKNNQDKNQASVNQDNVNTDDVNTDDVNTDDVNTDDVNTLRYYERDFLTSLKRNGTLEEEKLARTYMNVRNTVEDKLRGYCREDTIAYYRKTVKEAWKQVETSGTSEVASKVYDESLLWLLLDEGFKEHTEEVFRDIDFTPQPWWWWYWYTYSHHHPRPTSIPRKSPGKTPKIPGSELADNIATSLEKTAGNIVTNLEKFADSILPAPPPSTKTSTKPAHHKASCVCACHSCACVCACVSCACACAGGGGVG